MKRTFFLWSAFVLTTVCAAANPSVSLKVEKLSIPTYRIGPEDPNPPLWRSRVYPYSMQTDITGVKADSAHTAVIMENPYIKVIVLPELGGRLYGAFDKTHGNWDFLYCNDVIKPGLVGLRGAWLSGGIEWNFPSLGHTVTTISPVLWTTRRHSDGSASVFIGDTEWVRGMRWTVELRLYPDRSLIHVVTTLYNRTLTHNNGYYWANAAVHATEDVQVIFPPTNFVVSHGRRRVFHWPIHDGMDLSWYKNIPFAGDFFCGLPGDFNGAYYHTSDRGTVHIGNRYEVPGKKFWTWGTARSGAIWEKLLTDHSGQYIEIQAGRLPNQADTWIFEPHTVERWEEFWYPVNGLGGFVQANSEAAVNLTWQERDATVAVNVTRPRRGLRVILLGDDQSLAAFTIPELIPGQAFVRTVHVRRKPKRPGLLLQTRTGETLLHYRFRPVEGPIPCPPKPRKPESQMTANELALRGFELEKDWNPEGAVIRYRKSLQKDPYNQLALVWLGLSHFKNGLFDSALVCFDRAVQENPDNLNARYYRALCLLQKRDTTGAQSDLWLVLRRRPYSHLAPFVLASIEVKRQHLSDAAALLRRGLRSQPLDFKTRALLAAVYRHLGKTDSAQAILARLLRDDPLNALAHAERYFLTNSMTARTALEKLLYQPPGIYYRGAEDYLQLAWDYADFGFTRDAAKVLRFYLRNVAGDRPYPLALYTLAWLESELGHDQQAKRLLAQAQALQPDYVFPHRVESIDVLRCAANTNVHDWKARLYLGTLLTAKHRWREGERELLAAFQIDSSYSVVCRNLGQIAWQKRRDYRAATAWYERALRSAPNDWHVFVALDRLYGILQADKPREALFRSASPRVRRNFNVKLREALFYVDTGRYQRALDILRRNTFFPWEGWTGAHQVYLLAHFRRGLTTLERGATDSALADFRATLLYPENLGTGRPAYPRFARSFYFLGLAFEKAGAADSARFYFRKAAAETDSPASALGVYRALALRKLGQKNTADSLLQAGIRQLERVWRVPERRNARTAYTLGLLYTASGNSQKAEWAFAEALRMDPESRWIRWRL